MFDRSLANAALLVTLPILSAWFAHRRLRRLRAFASWGPILGGVILLIFVGLITEVSWITTSPLPRDEWPAYWYLMIPAGAAAYFLLNLFTYREYDTVWEAQRDAVWKAMPEDGQIMSLIAWKNSLWAIDDAEYEALRSGTNKDLRTRRRMRALLRHQEKDLASVVKALTTATDQTLVVHRHELEERLTKVRTARLGEEAR